MAKGLRGRVGKQYKGTQRTRKAVHGEGSVELAKWTFPIISLARVAPHQTVVRCSCKENGGPDILLVAMFSTHSQEDRHGPHNHMLPQ
jgi:hypothetical protein